MTRSERTARETRKVKGSSHGKKSTSEKSRKTQTFSITAPTAQSVQLVADFTHWKDNPINLHQEGSGVWRATVELEPGEHHYRSLVDGQWRDDPECTLRIPNPYGSQDAVRQVG